jgi:putative oxidoreductase
LSALGLQAVNVLAVVSYAHVLFKDGYEAAIGQHYLWAFMLLILIVHGPGKWSIDGWVESRQRSQSK